MRLRSEGKVEFQIRVGTRDIIGDEVKMEGK